MQNGYAHLRGPIDVTNRPSLSYFINSVFPKVLGQEAWYEWAHDQDTWKQRAYFLAMNCNERTGFYNLVAAISGSKDKVVNDEMHKQLLSVKLPKCSPEELGSIINDLVMTNMPAKEEEKKKEEEHILGAPKPQPLAQEFVFVAAAAEEKPLSPALVQDYRKRAGLAVTFPPLRIAKQLMLAAMQTHVDSLLGKNQQAFEPFIAAHDAETLEACVAGVNQQRLADLLNEKKASFATFPIDKEAAKDPCVFLQAAIDLYSGVPVAAALERQAKTYLRQFPKPCDALVDVITKL
jgi:hypothetical protein